MTTGRIESISYNYYLINSYGSELVEDRQPDRTLGL
jgi:hypothetical protein